MDEPARVLSPPGIKLEARPADTTSVRSSAQSPVISSAASVLDGWHSTQEDRLPETIPQKLPLLDLLN
jgi:hypothetical protein